MAIFIIFIFISRVSQHHVHLKMDDIHVDVAIIGVGISGLSAACLLKKSGLSVAVLEAQDRVGGRTYTVRDPTHGWVDVGGAYIGPTQNRVYRLIKELGLEWTNDVKRVSLITDGAQEKKIVGGTQQLSEGMSDQLGADVDLSSPVTSVTQDDAGAVVHTVDWKVVKSTYLISAIPLPLLSRVSFSPPLPGLKAQLIQRVSMGSIIKTNMFYSTPFWRELDLSGIAMSDTGPSVTCFDDTKPDGSHPAIMAFILADQCCSLCQLTKEERKQKLCQQFAAIFKCKKFLEPVGYVEKNWMEDVYSGGCYTVALPPGVLTQYGREIRKPHHRLYFAGTETSTEWMGFMEGAIQAGERAAREVLFAERKIKESEIMQDEPESEDFPARPLPTSWVQQSMPSVTAVVAGVVLAACVAVVAVILKMLG
ncbi:LOW QUALITY PROTEIN: amine oxidase [flavin-containing] B-like [Haliotis rubra]|uniref:LOW QUALITY PROTEIN: amine oxidase [flavin-containing] B-like n=1 Tax=Haliotis rubra TaxID=36100 RepID=UPI001EE54582|nr:LOW QUALITY PROTEIN: amine oxidase [flavin-containing] B-like [Haliotis rubra]